MLVQIEFLFSNSDNDDVKSSFRLDDRLWWETLKCDGKCIIPFADWRRVPRAYLAQILFGPAGYSGAELEQ